MIISISDDWLARLLSFQRPLLSIHGPFFVFLISGKAKKRKTAVASLVLSRPY